MTFFQRTTKLSAHLLNNTKQREGRMTNNEQSNCEWPMEKQKPGARIKNNFELRISGQVFVFLINDFLCF